MGGVISQLCWLLVQHRCRPSSVASSLTFAPPDPPFYELRDVEGGEGNELEWALDPIAMGTEFRDVEICIMKTKLGSYIPGFLFRHPEAKLTLLFSHGNAADCGAMRERYVQLVLQIRVNVFAYDYTGYGAASGTPSEQHTYSDICAAYDYLVSKNICPNPSEQIVLYGQSVGSGPSCKLASTKSRPIRGMILHSPIMSGIRVLVENRGPLACCDIYPNINRITQVRAPVLIIHGDHDEEVAFNHGQRLQEKVPKEHQRDPCWVRGGGHNDIVEEFPDQYYPAVARFVRSLESDDQGEDTITEFFPEPRPSSASDTISPAGVTSEKLVVG